MKNYKEFEKIPIGGSDIATLIAVSCGSDSEPELGKIKFGKDGNYSAYECFGEVEIGEHYEKVNSGKRWLKLYDDYNLVYDNEGAPLYDIGVDFEENFSCVDIYRAGDFGCIIHWHY